MVLNLYNPINFVVFSLSQCSYIMFYIGEMVAFNYNSSFTGNSVFQNYVKVVLELIQ